MKLSDFETSHTNLRQGVQNHLVMYAGENDIVIISDVPRISEEQYEKLYKISFKERLRYGVGDEVSFMPILWDGMFRDNEEKWHKWVETRRQVIRTMTWNKFVEFVKENYPNDEDDDFDE